MVGLELDEVVEGVFELQLPIPFENGRVNVFIFRDGRELDLLDCGMNSEESLATLRAALARVGADGWRLRRLLVTHIHPDHYGAAGVICGEYGAELYLHRLEVPMVNPRYLELDQLVAEVGRHLQANGVPEEEADIQRNASRAMRDFVVPADVSVQLDGAETVVMGDKQLRVEWTPGHSPGHVSLFNAGDGTLVVGDAFVTTKQESMLAALTQRPELHGPPMYYTPDWESAKESVRRLSALEPEVAATGHGRPMRGPVMRQALRMLAQDFDVLAVPRRGRYVNTPAVADENGVVSVPPPVRDPLPGILMGIGAAVVVGAAVRSLRGDGDRIHD
jgi:glyoxylase-like metal-dependent hydrolase (beta-lactamase superfamily II)